MHGTAGSKVERCRRAETIVTIHTLSGKKSGQKILIVRDENYLVHDQKDQLIDWASAYAGDRSDLLMRMRYVAMMMRTGVQCFGKNIANFFKNNFRHEQSIFFVQIFFPDKVSGIFKLRNPPFIRNPPCLSRKIFGFWNLLKRPKMRVLAIFVPRRWKILGIWDFHKKPPLVCPGSGTRGGFLTWIALIW